MWNACEGRGSSGRQVRLGLLAGTRRAEIAKLTRDRILSDRLVLPPFSTKTGEQHGVTLTELMRTVIAAQPTSKLAFPSDKTGGVISGWTKLVAGLQQESSVAFTKHDLRRTCRTLMSRLGVDTDIAQVAIGHSAKASSGCTTSTKPGSQRWSNEALADRKHTLSLELAPLDQLQLVFYRRALEGDVQCGALVAKIIERRGVMLGLHVPQAAVLKIVDEATPKETTTDKLERALEALITDQHKKDDEPTTH